MATVYILAVEGELITNPTGQDSAFLPVPVEIPDPLLRDSGAKGFPEDTINDSTSSKEEMA